MQRTIYNEDHELFRKTVRSFIEKEMVPFNDQWEHDGIVPRELFAKMGANGFFGMAAPAEYGGGGVDDFRFNAVLNEEMQRAGVNAAGAGPQLHNDVCVPYFTDQTDDEQKARWLPGICSGELICAVGMTEPSTGSDLAAVRTTAIRDGDHYIVNGSKTFITNGINADLVITVVKTDPSQRHAGMSLLVIERGMEGFERGRNLEKLGMHAQDTAELFFNDVRVPVANRLGEEGTGFASLVRNLAQERMSCAVVGVAAARAALGWTLEYTKERQAFGQPVAAFQNTRFRLAEMATEVEVGQAFIDKCVQSLVDGDLTAEEAAMAKWWATDLQARVVDAGVQLHGGYGYMLEYPIARAYADARVTRIYGGTNEIMKEIIGRSLLA